MSDEEKKAIKYWKTHMEILHWNTQLASEHYIKVLLDLIEKQSKEIEELKQLLDDRLWNEHISKETNKKWQDKIKAKIEEVDKDENASIPDFIEYAKEYATQKLQSLLEKE